MNRRTFMQITGVGCIASSLPLAGLAAEVTIDPSTSPLAGSLFYTQDKPGRWAKKVAGHVPNVEKTVVESVTKVRVVTPHEMKDYEHYIVKHVLFDKDFKLLGEHSFDPIQEKAPVSEYELNNYSGIVYALSVCNQHDSWLNSLEV